MFHIIFIYVILFKQLLAASLQETGQTGGSGGSPWTLVAKGVDPMSPPFAVVDQAFFTTSAGGLQLWDKDHWEDFDDAELVTESLKHYRDDDGIRKLVAVLPSKLGVHEWDYESQMWRACKISMTGVASNNRRGRQLWSIGHIKASECAEDRKPIYVLAGFYIGNRLDKIYVEIEGKKAAPFSTSAVGTATTMETRSWVEKKVKKRSCGLFSFGGCGGRDKPEKVGEWVTTMTRVPPTIKQLQVGCGYLWALSSDKSIYKTDASEGTRVRWRKITTTLAGADLVGDEDIQKFTLDNDCNIFVIGTSGATYKWHIGMWLKLTDKSSVVGFNVGDIDIDNDGFMYAADYETNAVAMYGKKVWVPAIRFGPTIGYWNKFALSNVGGGGGSMKITYSKTDGTEVTKEEEKAFTKGISATAGVKVSAKPVGCGVETSLAISGSLSQHVAQKIDESVQSSYQKGSGSACSAKAPDEAWTGYRWMIDREANDKSTMSVSTCYFHFKTGAGQQNPPLCMPGYCKDMDCQECIDEKYSIAPPDHTSNEMEVGIVQISETPLQILIPAGFVLIAAYACYNSRKSLSTPLLEGYEQEL